MKIVEENFIQEVVFEYEDEKKMESHKKHMIASGFKVVPGSTSSNNPLMVTYQKREISYKK